MEEFTNTGTRSLWFWAKKYLYTKVMQAFTTLLLTTLSRFLFRWFKAGVKSLLGKSSPQKRFMLNVSAGKNGIIAREHSRKPKSRLVRILRLIGWNKTSHWLVTGATRVVLFQPITDRSWITFDNYMRNRAIFDASPCLVKSHWHRFSKH